MATHNHVVEIKVTEFDEVMELLECLKDNYDALPERVQAAIQKLAGE